MSHRGFKSGAGRQGGSRDRRIIEIVADLAAHGVVDRSLLKPVADPSRSAGQERHAHPFRMPIFTGTVMFSLPYANWYKVQFDGPGFTLPCTMGGDCALSTPMGPRPTGVIPPYSHVVVMIPAGRTYGIILCAYPLVQQDGRLTCPDYLVQGSQCGVQREAVYGQPFSLYRDGRILLFGSNRPLDSTTMDWGRICETGLGLSIDPFMGFLRASEICGLWMHYWDDYMRLAGWNLDLQTAAHELTVRLDEGENRLSEMHNVYPWESLGLYAPGTAIHETFDDKAVQFEIPRGKFDLKKGESPGEGDGEEDLQPIARYQEYGGYLGQGRRRIVMVPGQTTGKRFYADDPVEKPDFGVFEESIGLDGSYAMRSARQLVWMKHVLIPVPKEMRLPEDQSDGDDARKNNYKFSGTFGGGAAHKVGDVEIPGDSPHITQLAGIMDLLSYAFNWQPLHPFHYHQADYAVPQESEIKNLSGAPDRAQDFLDFGQLANQMYMDYPAAKNIRVDSRYGNVKYHSRIAYHAMLPDGSVICGDGYGSEFRLSGGNIYWNCPGDFIVAPGRNFTVIAGQDINLRAHNSVDITAGTKDVRIKAEKNLQILGGNENGGGVLIESKAPYFAADFDKNIGEDVNSGGIILKARDSSIVGWAGNIYLRTGGDPLAGGQIVLDSSLGNNRVVLKGGAVEIFSQSVFAAYIGPHDENNKVQAVYEFNAAQAILGKGVLVGGPAVILGNLLVNGQVADVSGYISISGGEHVGTALNPGGILAAFQNVSTGIKEQEKAGEKEHKALFPDGLYLSDQPGNAVLIQQAQFSYRDDDGEQYHATDFTLPESRWQQMVRLNMGSGGSSWDDEPVVNYQGKKQLPYPGRKKWETDNTLIQLAELTMFDAQKGLAKDRPGPYETPKLGALTPVPPAKGFKIMSR